MTGMKEGAGEDPFAEDVESEEPSDKSSGAISTESAEVEEETAETKQSQQTQQQTIQIPYKFRRDGVQDGRNRVPLFLQPETKNAERDALREMEERFNDDVSLTDLREALMRVGLEHLDEAETHLEEWGYGMTFDD
ncbi:hypothetical protein AUR64_02490 [Haloprofundus marisrubri]|uniref:Uncharacterized protein n=1 Tax=Haloprofundus marisrubri TaxID=1514971 RepID=A0A0W1R2L8_9EURY|nr:hypothetical protein [Haloprofundus marisrubri]KTG07728.1 hypothetical protein AUR64_02490 [Haloprofundus marisrubri]